MSEPASISYGIAERYATAVFDLCLEAGALGDLEKNIEDMSAALAVSAELSEMISSPIVSRTEQEAAIAAIAKKLNLAAPFANGLALMAQKRRLFVLPQLLRQLAERVADHKGEVTAEVTSAVALSAAQSKKLADTLKAQVGKTVKVNATVDESLIGGLVVKVGSKMIDTSIRARLNSLQNAMKEVG
ncbi:MAG: F0F1 ATP synthase subunit delta [Pseudomonadota bacterium]